MKVERFMFKAAIFAVVSTFIGAAMQFQLSPLTVFVRGGGWMLVGCFAYGIFPTLLLYGMVAIIYGFVQKHK